MNTEADTSLGPDAVTKSIVIHEPYPDDYRDIGNNLRKEDVREIAGLTGVPPILAVKLSIESAHWCRVVSVDGKASMVFGVTKQPGCEDYGCVWLLSTPDIHKIRYKFLRESKMWLSAMFNSGPFNRLNNIADTRNDLHMRWLKWMGAVFDGDRVKKHYERFEIRR